MSRYARVERTTKETSVSIEVELDGQGKYEISTGIAFFDHMLAQVARHGFIDLRIQASGDLGIDGHHTVEDVGITLGQAIRQALGGGDGIRRYGFCLLPMDEALAQAALDISGRPYLSMQACFSSGAVGTFDTELVPEFFRALAMNSGVTLHLKLDTGTNTHHQVEALFKAFARSLDQAKQPEPRLGDQPLSTKGRVEL